MIDLHTHVLFGVDDGAESLESSRAMLQSAAESGIRVIAATSHYSRRCEALYDEHFALLSGIAQEYGIRLVSGMEYDYDLLSEVEPERLRGIAAGDFVLIDLKQPFVAPGAPQMFYELQLRGRRVVAAHPERLFAGRLRESVQTLRNAGVFFQINSGSILGCYGSRVRSAAWHLLRSGFCELIADDAHRAEGFRLRRCRELLSKYFPEEAIAMWFEENPERLLAGQALRIRRFAMRPLAALASRIRFGWSV